MSLVLANKEKLIELVKSRPELWKQSRKAPGLKQKIWDEIGVFMDTTGYDARRQWEILRDQLRRETKRYKQVPNYDSKWTFYHKMKFMLQEKNDSPSPTPNIIPADQIYTMQHGQPIIKVRQDLQDSNDSSFLGTSEYSVGMIATNAEPSTSAGVSSSTQLHHYSDVDNEDMTRTQNMQSPVYMEEDEDYHFAMSIVPSLRGIRRSNKLRLRSKILDLIATTIDEEESAEQLKEKREVKEDIVVKYEEKFVPIEVEIIE